MYHTASTNGAFETLLTLKKPSKDLENCLRSLIKDAVTHSKQQCYTLLLHRINWYEYPFSAYPQHLLNLIRVYKARGKEATKVAYNLLAETLRYDCVRGQCDFIRQTEPPGLKVTEPPTFQNNIHIGVECLLRLFCESTNREMIIQSFSENYPHKLAPLRQHLNYLQNLLNLLQALNPTTTPHFHLNRSDILSIIIRNLLMFDTELVCAYKYSAQHFPDETKILQERCRLIQSFNQTRNRETISFKLDTLLARLLDFLGTVKTDPYIMHEMFLVFQANILTTKSTSCIQYLVFYLAESSKKMSSMFTSLLLSNIVEDRSNEHSKRIFTQSCYSLACYANTSKLLQPNTIKKVANILIGRLNDLTINLPDLQIKSNIKLYNLFSSCLKQLNLLQTLMHLGLEIPSSDILFHEELNKTFNLCQRKLKFRYFINPQLMEKYGLESLQSQHTLQFTHKLLPMILDQCSAIIDPLYRFRCFKSSEEVKKFCDQKKTPQLLCQVKREEETNEQSLKKLKLDTNANSSACYSNNEDSMI